MFELYIEYSMKYLYTKIKICVMNSSGQIKIIFFIFLLVYFQFIYNTLYTRMAIIIVSFIIIGMILSTSAKINKNTFNYTTAQEYRRKSALKIAKIYLAPYENIWIDLVLSNKYVTIELGDDPTLITVYEKVHPYRKYRVINSDVHDYTDLWDMYCTHFNSHKTYNDLLNDANHYRLSVMEGFHEAYHKQESVALSSSKKTITKKIDINNSSEVELTELPGISIVIAKKIIKKRDAIDGFNSTKDFFLFLNLKPHIEEQLREMIICEKLKNNNPKISRSEERRIDL